MLWWLLQVSVGERHADVLVVFHSPANYHFSRTPFVLHYLFIDKISTPQPLDNLVVVNFLGT